MSGVWGHIRTWVDTQPVAHLAWLGTAVAVLAIVLAFRPLVRRMARAGDRAPRRLGVLCGAVALGCALLALLDSGYRTKIGTTLAREQGVAVGESLSASSNFPIGDYYVFQQKVERDPGIVATIPELVTRVSWTPAGVAQTNLAKTRTIGLPSDIAVSRAALRSGSKSLSAELRRWRDLIRSLKRGHAAITTSMARSQSLATGNLLFTRDFGTPLYASIQAVTPGGLTGIDGPAVILPLSTLQGLMGSPGSVNDVEVVYQASDAADSALRRHIMASVGSIPIKTVKASHWSYAATVRVSHAGAFDHWLAVVPALALCLSGAWIAFLGRRRPNTGEIESISAS